MLEESLLGAVLCRAGEAGQVDQDGDLLGRVLEGLRRQVEVEGHLTAGRGGIVCQLEQLAAEGGDCGLGRDGHCACFWCQDLETKECLGRGYGVEAEGERRTARPVCNACLLSGGAP